MVVWYCVGCGLVVVGVIISGCGCVVVVFSRGGLVVGVYIVFGKAVGWWCVGGCLVIVSGWFCVVGGDGGDFNLGTIMLSLI